MLYTNYRDALTVVDLVCKSLLWLFFATVQFRLLSFCTVTVHYYVYKLRCMNLPIDGL